MLQAAPGRSLTCEQLEEVAGRFGKLHHGDTQAWKRQALPAAAPTGRCPAPAMHAIV